MPGQYNGQGECYRIHVLQFVVVLKIEVEMKLSFFKEYVISHVEVSQEYHMENSPKVLY